MAIFHSHIFDNASGSVGNITICKSKGKNIAKGKIFFKSKKQSPAQLIQQTRFKVLSDLSFNFCTAIQAGAPHQSWSTARTQFIGINQHAVEIDKDTLAITIHRERITCTTGNPDSTHREYSYPGKRTHRSCRMAPSAPQPYCQG